LGLLLWQLFFVARHERALYLGEDRRAVMRHLRQSMNLQASSPVVGSVPDVMSLLHLSAAALLWPVLECLDATVALPKFYVVTVD
jgi:hypothetical protein